MKQGKVSEVVLKRSVLKNITAKSEKIISGGKIAGDCGIIQMETDRMAAATSGIVDYAKEYREYYTFYKAFNNLMAKGAVPTAMMLNIIMPPAAKEKQLKEVIKAYDFLCRQHKIAICGGHTQYSEEVSNILSSVTMFGEQTLHDCDIMSVSEQEQAKPAQGERRMSNTIDCEAIVKRESANRDIMSVSMPNRELQIVMTKAMGIEGTAILSKDREEVLRERFHGSFCERCLKFREYISVEKEAKVAFQNGALFAHDVSGAGVFGAIWELASAFGMGAEVDLRKIPVWQETIEVTELFDINPYKMASQGSLLIVVQDGEEMVNRLEEQEIPAAVIGRLVPGNDKVLINNDEKRFLEPPRGDEIYKH